MKIKAYLLINRDGAMEVRKNLPEPRLHQVAVRLLLDIDDKWVARPVPSVELTISDDHIQPMAVVRSEPIDAEQEDSE